MAQTPVDKAPDDPLDTIREMLTTVHAVVNQTMGMLLAIKDRQVEQDAVLEQLRGLAARAEPMLAAAENNPVLRFATSRRVNRG